MRDVQAGVSYDINVRPTVITDPDVYWAQGAALAAGGWSAQGIVKASDEDIKFLAKAEASGAGQNGRRPSRAGRPGSSSTGSGLR